MIRKINLSREELKSTKKNRKWKLSRLMLKPISKRQNLLSKLPSKDSPT